MAEKQKKRQSRRAYLNDFHLNERGEYVYEGKLIRFVETAITYRQYLMRIIMAAALMLIFTVAAECLPAVAMSRFGLTMIPWLGQIIAASLVVFSIWQIFRGKNPMREYVYKSSQEKLPMRVFLMAVFSFFTAATETIYILVKGYAEEAAATILRPVFSLLCGLIAFYLYRLVKSTKWEQVVRDESL